MIAYLARGLVLKAARILTPLEALAPGALLIENGVIRMIGPAASVFRPRGAEPVDFPLEGPFLNPVRPGALRSEWFQSPSLDFLKGLLAAGRDAALIALDAELRAQFTMARGRIGYRA